MNIEGYARMASNPVFFERNRVFRLYTGGKLFHDFFGDDGLDGNYPEEWIASGVKALNRNPQSEYEGISMVRGSGIRLRTRLRYISSPKVKECLRGRHIRNP